MAATAEERVTAEREAPIRFSVRSVARDMAIGSAWVWAAATTLLGLFGGAGGALVGLICGWAAGWGGGALSGFAAGLAVREKSPSLASREVRRMGVEWALATIVGGALVAGVATFMVSGWEPTPDPSKPLVEGLLGSCSEVLGLLLFILALVPVGFLLGAGLAAVHMTRRLRLRTEDLSRWRVTGVAAVWTLAAAATGLLAMLSTAWVSSALGLRN